MKRDKGKKGKKKMPVNDSMDDNFREQVKPNKERPEEMCDESWARPGDDETDPRELPRVTAGKDK